MSIRRVLKSDGVHRLNAFTLVELLVVVAIITILLALFTPTLRAARESAKLVQCGAKLHNGGMAAYNFATSNSGSLPQSY